MITRRKPRIAEINVVPYVDVMLVLLIIFMVAAPLLTQGFEVNLPKIEARTVSLPDPIVVTVLKDESYRINIGDQLNQAASITTIRARLKKIIAQNPDLAVLVEGDAEVSYRAVLDLLSTLQNTGIHNVGLVTQPPSAPTNS